MKTMLLTFLSFALILPTFSMEDSVTVNTLIECEGVGEIRGMFGKKKVDTIFYFNSIELRNPEVDEGELEAIYGHKVKLGKKEYVHAADLAGCKVIGDEVQCFGYGIGNGPELSITINLDNGTGEGKYFNPSAHRNVSTPNEYNTYVYSDLSCKEVQND